MNLTNIKKAHFIGIGGIGVSALARMMLLEGKRVSGSDISMGLAAQRIKKLGGKVIIGHKKSNLPKDADVVIYSPAIGKDNPELVLAEKLNIPTYSYPQALGLISKDKYTIAISGAHGKTTTTAMIAEILISAKKSPTVVVGSFLKKQKDNFVPGKGKYFVVEACEYQESFLNLSPRILVITNIDNDHLDYFKTVENIQKAFAKMISKVPESGFVVRNPKDAKVKTALKLASRKAKLADYTKEKIGVKLAVPGQHNILNAQAALAVARLVKIKKPVAQKALKKFSGTWRRFEYKGETRRGALIYDDYAHHPTEIRATLKAAKQEFPKKKITVVFQPHLYSRTKLLLDDFAKSFSRADELIITDIYAAREKYDKTIHARDLVKRMQRHCERPKGAKQSRVCYISDFSEIKKRLKQADKNSVIITIGAGDVYKIGEGLIRK